jgi:membrane fusion protein (multidrug efflux system)
MADTVLKLRPETETTSAGRPASLLRWLRARLRLVLLVFVPLAAAAVGLVFYLTGGRYISTDNAYVGAQKVLITPDISGKVSGVSVREGQHVAAGDKLFEIDPEPFRITVDQAKAKLESVRTDFTNLKTNYKSYGLLVELAEKNVELKQHDVDRKTTLLASHTGSQADLDTAAAGLVTAQLQAQLGRQQQMSVYAQLLGNPDLPIEQFPPYQQAAAVLEQAQRDLAHTVLRAPMAGTATQVDNIQLGRFITAGAPVFSIVDDSAPWVDANPKETDVTNLREGEKVTIDVDAFPERSFHGTVSSVSPGTGSQFAILPPQNAIGNWVKVVQRVPVRITFDAGQDVHMLRAGMSVTVSIDTGTNRTRARLAHTPTRAAAAGKP